MGRSRVEYNEKIEAVEKYKRGEGSQDNIAREYGVDPASFRQWITNYEAMGPSRLAAQQTNNRYSVELKTAAIEAYLRGEGSQLEMRQVNVLREMPPEVYCSSYSFFSSSVRSRR